MAELNPQTEQTLADMSDEDWSALSARVRPATSAQQLKDIAATVIRDKDQLNAFMAIADPKRLAKPNGDIDPEMVSRHATVFFGASNPPGPAPGDIARAELEKRHGVKTSAPAPIERPGDIARAQLEKRHGVKTNSQ